MMTRRGALRGQQGQQGDADGEMEDADVTLTGTTEENNTGGGDRRRAEDPATASARPAQAPPLQAPELQQQQLLSTLAQLITSMSAGDFRASTPVTFAPATASNSMSAGASGAHSANFTRCTARFDGSSRDAEVLEAFLDAVEIYKECAGVSDEHALRGLAILLQGEAAVWWRGVRDSISTWTDALARLRSVYGIASPAHKVFREIFNNEQRDDERAEQFMCKTRALIAKLPYKLDENIQIDMCYGLLHRRVRKRVPRESVLSLDELFCKVRIAEDLYKESAQNKLPAPVAGSTTGVSVRSKEQGRPRCSFCKIFGHVSDDCRKLREKALNSKTANADSGNLKGLRCYGCGKQGVVRARCDVCNPKPSSSKKEPPATIPDTGEQRKIEWNSVTVDSRSVEFELEKCKGGNSAIDLTGSRKCEGGNSTIDLTGSPKCEGGNSANRFNSENRFNSDEQPTVSANQPMIEVSILGKYGVAIVDTGATHSIASPMLYRVLRDSGVDFKETQRIIRLADGTKTQRALLTAEVTVVVEGREVSGEFLVLPGDETKTLLGMEFLSQAGIVVDTARGRWMFADDIHRHYDFVRTYTIESADTDLMRVDASELALRPDEGTMLTPEQKLTLNEFISERAAQFAYDGPATEFATHRIKVSSDQEPIASPPYRLSQQKKEALQKELNKLLQSGIIEECESPWAANVVLVPKKDGNYRLCIDYRKLNQVTEPDRYPLPRMEDVLHAAKASEYMTTLDLRSGYYHVAVANEDQDKTAFTTPLGTFRFKRMPMGLRNSGATFQRLMDRFRSNLKGVELLIYLDDVILLSPGPFENHLADLKAVFDRLGLYNLRVNRDKSHFARESVKFLGHIITPGGIQVDPNKTAAVDNMAVPENVKHLKCFLQTSSWFRRFINNYAEVARPLTDLLKKASVWRWGIEQQNAFERIKHLLVSAPILRQADESKPFILCTDSSGYCLGAVLMQGEGADERPIEYASRLLSSAERNYSTTEREALAVVWALGKFRGYVENAKIVVRTDHQPLRWLMSQRSPSGRLARWALILQDFDLDIAYTPGRSNVVADTLSRPVCAQDPDCDVCFTTIDMPKRSSGNIRENQLKDPEVRKIVEDLESDEPFRGRPWSDRGFIISDGILYRYSLESDEEEDACLVVPEHERRQVMIDLHDAPTAGHLGVERTLSRVRSRFHWPGMRSFVTNYIKECVPCQRYKADNRKPAGLLQTPAVARRFEVVSVDLFGPLVETPRKNRWVLIVEDVCSRWVELYPLESATSVECAQTLVNEVFLRYGVPRRLISDNGVQFVSEVMQQVCHVLGIDQMLTPFYHPQANPIERKNRDLKPQLAILVGQDHETWDLHLAAVRFAMNSAVTASTGFSPAYLTFGRELRAPTDSITDMRGILAEDNFVPNITPYLKRLGSALDEAREIHEKAQACRKETADKARRGSPEYQVGDLVLLKTQGSNDAGRGQTAKFIPRRDGPYKIREITSPTTYLLENVQTGIGIGKYHASHLTPFSGQVEPPVREKRKRGRPRRYLC